MWGKREGSGTDRNNTNGIDLTSLYGNYNIYR